MASKQFFAGLATTSASAIIATQGTITGQSTATWPPTGDYIVRIDGVAPGTSTAISENVLVTANVQGTGVCTVTRGQDSTGAQAFAANATLTPIISPKMVNDAFARIDGSGIALPYAIGAALPASGFGTLGVKIDDILVGTDTRYPAATSQITFLNTSNSGTNLLPTGYRHLMVEWYARGDTAALSTSIGLRFNNIGTATYDYDYVQISGTTTTVPTESLGATSILSGYMPAGTATANYFGQGEIRVKYYQGVVGNKLVQADNSWAVNDSTSNQVQNRLMGKWRTTATAITRIDLIPAAGNFVVGSLFTLWGVP